MLRNLRDQCTALFKSEWIILLAEKLKPMPKCLPGSFPRRQGHSRNRRGKGDLKIPANALRFLQQTILNTTGDGGKAIAERIPQNLGIRHTGEDLLNLAVVSRMFLKLQGENRKLGRSKLESS